MPPYRRRRRPPAEKPVVPSGVPEGYTNKENKPTLQVGQTGFCPPPPCPPSLDTQRRLLATAMALATPHPRLALPTHRRHTVALPLAVATGGPRRAALSSPATAAVTPPRGRVAACNNAAEATLADGERGAGKARRRATRNRATRRGQGRGTRRAPPRPTRRHRRRRRPGTLRTARTAAAVPAALTGGAGTREGSATRRRGKRRQTPRRAAPDAAEAQVPCAATAAARRVGAQRWRGAAGTSSGVEGAGGGAAADTDEAGSHQTRRGSGGPEGARPAAKDASSSTSAGWAWMGTPIPWVTAAGSPR